MPQIPSVKGLPFLGSALDLSGNILDFFGQNFAKQGDIFLFHLPNRQLITTRSATIANHLFVKNHKNYRKDYAANKLKKRPLLQNMEEALKLYNLRAKEYEKVAKIVVDVENKDIKDIVKEILGQI